VIPAAAITAWGNERPWPTRAAVEQDLLLARTIVEIYRHPLLADELVFRGGTCLHQLHLASPRRYSEDLDFVRRSKDGIGPVLDALREVADSIGLEVYARDLSEHPKLRMRAPSEEDATALLRVKVEINTHESSPAMPLVRRPFKVENSWFSGTADVLTFHPEELVATKLRALYQRRKGRDLFDLWLALAEMELAPEAIIEAFGPYRPSGYTRAAATANLEAKVDDGSFRHDLDALVAVWPDGYDVAGAAQLLIDEIFSLL
jgi:predicted nucleotidyltransferase component of viral defense system